MMESSIQETRKRPKSEMSSEIEIWVVPFFGHGHLFPCIELCKHFTSRNCKANLIISSNLSSSIPSSFRQQSLVEVSELPSAPPAAPESGSNNTLHHHRKHHDEIAQGIEKLLSERYENGSLPSCVVIDVMMGWTREIFNKFGISKIGFSTSGACSAAMEHAMWKAHPLDIKPGETLLLTGLPEEMGLTVSDLKRRPHGPLGWIGGPGGPEPGFPPGSSDALGSVFPPCLPGVVEPRMWGPPKFGDRLPWLEEVKDSIALLINTSDDLERPFIEYLANQIEKTIWDVGPLLPEQFWTSAKSLLQDREIRSNRQSNVTEDEVMEWLDSKPGGSVLYVSFDSMMDPTMQEFPQLANALESSERPFIWVTQPGSGMRGPPPQFLGNQPDDGYFPHGLDQKVGKRGLIIKGWAPQLLILSHPSTGGFLSHCGWNSTVEAIARGIPFLAWPLRGDQYYNAKLVVEHLRVGYMISDAMSQTVKKDDIINGIEMLMGDEEMKKRAATLSSKFHHGFPASSVASLDSFCKILTDVFSS